MNQKTKPIYFGTMMLLTTILFTLCPLPYGLIGEAAIEEAPIIVDDQPISTRYFLQDGHLMVPAQFLKHTGATVEWSSAYEAVVFRVDDILFATPVAKQFTDEYDKMTGAWQRGTLATPPVEVDGDIYVPLLDVLRIMEMPITYNPQQKQTHITTGQPGMPNRIFRGDGNQKLVALTFDDGPEMNYTPRIMDILREKGVPATFFVVGQQVQAHPDLMRSIVEEGHAIGNHSWSHPRFPLLMSTEMMNEVQETQRILYQATGRRPDLFRPPYGELARSDAQSLTDAGFRIAMWSVDTLDWSGASADDILEAVEEQISPGGIILQHTIPNQPGILEGTVEALPEIIDDLQAQGYTFVTMQTLLDWDS